LRLFGGSFHETPHHPPPPTPVDWTKSLPLLLSIGFCDILVPSLRHPCKSLIDVVLGNTYLSEFPLFSFTQLSLSLPPPIPSLLPDRPRRPLFLGSLCEISPSEGLPLPSLLAFFASAWRGFSDRLRTFCSLGNRTSFRVSFLLFSLWGSGGRIIPLNVLSLGSADFYWPFGFLFLCGPLWSETFSCDRR